MVILVFIDMLAKTATVYGILFIYIVAICCINERIDEKQNKIKQ